MTLCVFGAFSDFVVLFVCLCLYVDLVCVSLLCVVVCVSVCVSVCQCA